MSARDIRPSRRLPRLSALAALALCAFAAACAADGSSIDTLPQDRYPITVRETRSMVEIPVAADKIALSLDEIDALVGLAAEYRAAGHGPVIIALPVGGGADETAVRIGADIRDLLYERGLAYTAIRGTAYDAEGRADPPLVVMVDRYVAEAPKCHDAWEDFSRTLSGRNTRNFGCAMQANLAAIVTDPADLLGARPEDPSDVQRRGAVFDAYRRGESTITQRGDDEGAGVSDAVD